MAEGPKQWPKTKQYLEAQDIDPATVLFTGLSPAGYYKLDEQKPDGSHGFRLNKDGTWAHDGEVHAWPKTFDYAHFQKCILADSFTQIRQEKANG